MWIHQKLTLVYLLGLVVQGLINALKNKNKIVDLKDYIITNNANYNK